jgi:hypothetical protein
MMASRLSPSDLAALRSRAALAAPELELLLGWTALSAVVFASLYRLSRHLSPLFFAKYEELYVGVRRDWDSRVGSTIHAVLVTVAGLYFIGCTGMFNDDPATGKIGSMAATQETSMVLAVSLGYFCVDL